MLGVAHKSEKQKQAEGSKGHWLENSTDSLTVRCNSGYEMGDIEARRPGVRSLEAGEE